MSETVTYGKNGISSGSVVYGYGGLSSGTFIYDENTFATRNIPTFAGSQYGTIDTPITFPGNFEVEVEFATTNTANQLFLGDDHTVSHYFNLISTHVSIFIANVNYIYAFGGATPQDGKVHVVKYALVGTSLTVYLDGISLGSQTVVPYTGANNFRIGSSNSVTIINFQGQILSVKFTDAGTVVANYVFDSGSTTEQFARGSTIDKITLINFATTDWNRYTQQRNIVHDAGVIGEAWGGDNVVVNGTFDADTDWGKGAGWSIADGKATSDGTTSNLTTTSGFNPALIVGIRILGTVKLLDRTAGNIAVSVNGTGGSDSGILTSNGVHTFIGFGPTTITSNFLITSGTGYIGSIDNITIKPLLEVA